MLESLQIVAKGGGCFLAGTRIGTPDGDVAIETLKKGSSLVSFNEKTKLTEESKVGKVEKFKRDHHYVLNGIIKATGEHPFYTTKGLKEVKDLKVGDVLLSRYDTEVVLEQIQYIGGDVTVYNLIDVAPNHNYYAENFLVHNKGGSCFLRGTMISTVDGYIFIQDIKPGDQVLSYNEKLGMNEIATVAHLDVKQADKYYVINNNVKVTGEHPFYVDSAGKLEQKLADEITKGDLLVHVTGARELVESVQVVEEEGVTVFNLINVTPNNNYFANGYLVHNKGFSGGGARASSGSRSSSSSKSSSSYTPAKGTSTKKAGDSVKTKSGKTVKSSTKTPTKKEFSNSKGVVGDNGYTPRFTNGYKAPEGSVVYYRDNNLTDYFFLAYILNNDNPARPENQQAIIVQPDGKEVQAKPEPGGADGMLILNWIILIIVVLAIIAGIAALANKLTER